MGESNLDQEIKSHLDEVSWERVKRTRNPAVQIIALQSKDLNIAFKKGWLDSIRFYQLMDTLGRLYDEQGKCEHIKDFPYPSSLRPSIEFSSKYLYYSSH